MRWTRWVLGAGLVVLAGCSGEMDRSAGGGQGDGGSSPGMPLDDGGRASDLGEPLDRGGLDLGTVDRGAVDLGAADAGDMGDGSADMGDGGADTGDGGADAGGADMGDGGADAGDTGDAEADPA